jgi:DNA-directed RNA polymerase subunit RPC12/RpoP
VNRKYNKAAAENKAGQTARGAVAVRLTELKKDTMSASARRNLRLATFEAGQEEPVRVRQHTLSPLDAVERCVECGRRLSAGQHELCPRCDSRLFIAAWRPQEVAL